jgi:hypothetical protein
MFLLYKYKPVCSIYIITYWLIKSSKYICIIIDILIYISVCLNLQESCRLSLRCCYIMLYGQISLLISTCYKFLYHNLVNTFGFYLDLGSYTSLTPAIFIEVPVPCQESRRYYIFVC